MRSERHYLDLSALILVNFLWAAQYPAYKVASEQMSPSALGFWTFVLATILLLPFLWRERRRVMNQRDRGSRRRFIAQFAVVGLVGLVPPSVMLAWGIARSTASNGAILSLTIPVLMMVLSVLMLGEKLTVLRVVGLVMALAGTLAMSWSDVSGDLLKSRLLVGNFVIFLAGLGAAFYNVYTKALLIEFSELEVLIYGYVSGAIFCAAVWLVTDRSTTFAVSLTSWSLWISLLVLGALSWGIAMVLWMWVLKRMEASQVAVSIYLLSVFGVLLSTATLGERPGLAQLLGGVLVLLATYLVASFEARSTRTEARTSEAPGIAASEGNRD